MRKFLVLAITVATLAWAAPAKAAETIEFNPDGIAGGLATINILGLDWSVGNSLLVESVSPDPTRICLLCTPPIVDFGTDGKGTVYFQANLANAYLVSGTGLFNNGTSGIYYTVVAGYGVNIEQTILNGDATSTFTLDLSNPTNFFNVYVNTVPGSDLSGTCFVCGTLVLSAVAFDDSNEGYQAQFKVNNIEACNAPSCDPAQTPELLDQFSGDSYGGVQTLTGTGSTDIALKVTYVNTAYFPTLNTSATFITTNTSLINPYKQTDPSGCFDANGVFDAGNSDGDCADFSELLGATSVGAINGTTSRIMTQTDANSSFVVEQLEVVPEPTTLSLLGLGLLLGGAHLRRRAKKNNA